MRNLLFRRQTVRVIHKSIINTWRHNEAKRKSQDKGLIFTSSVAIGSMLTADRPGFMDEMFLRYLLVDKYSQSLSR